MKSEHQLLRDTLWLIFGITHHVKHPISFYQFAPPYDEAFITWSSVDTVVALAIKGAEKYYELHIITDIGCPEERKDEFLKVDTHEKVLSIIKEKLNLA